MISSITVCFLGYGAEGCPTWRMCVTYGSAYTSPWPLNHVQVPTPTQPGEVLNPLGKEWTMPWISCKILSTDAGRSQEGPNGTALCVEPKGKGLREQSWIRESFSIWEPFLWM
jgi:hypothetical protein